MADSNTDAQLYNLQLANRQIQINEWTYNNRMETLFIFQVLFISLMITAILLYLRSAGVIGIAFVGYVVGILILLFSLIVANRAMYTNNTRDKKLWNKRNFTEDNQLGSPLSRGDPSYQAYIDRVRAKYGDAVSGCPAGCVGRS